MENEFKSCLGSRLRQIRNKQGLSASDVAAALGVSASTYREWENGRAIRGEPYVKLAKILQISLTELLTGEMTESSQVLSEFLNLEKQLLKFKETLYSSIYDDKQV